MLDPPLPDQFVERMRRLLGAEADAFLASYGRPAERSARANTGKVSARDLAALLGVDLEPVPWCEDASFLPEGVRVGATAAHAAGLFYIQDPSALAVVEALDVRPGHRVLDLAAAPGGKTTHIASKLGTSGVVVANEVDSGRLQALADNLDRWGSWRVAIAGETVERLARRLPGAFDRVLLDAPCSGEGLFRRSGAARVQWQPGHVRGSAERQRELLGQAARLVRPGGVLVYSTCTFAPEENERQVAAFLGAHGGWELLEIPWRPGFSPGRPDWSPGGPAELARTVRLWPHLLRGEGHFVAKLGRRDGGAAPGPDGRDRPGRRDPSRAGGRRPRQPGGVLAAWEAFSADALTRRPAPSSTPTGARAGARVVGDRAYLVPDELIVPGDLRWLRPGLLLGRSRPGRFEPAHALAMASTPSTVRRRRRLATGEASAWLRGEPLQA
ncbi:MAG TPA: RsmF rRNA methyltransferase first C-terminal domain-containing protein, partial [Actinomycetota bacterium]|nr:RsmF rRNA methyltransferase first C-terminal domain-containing protein [Actinomycetota bacterium]